jgi:hypothetical protein
MTLSSMLVSRDWPEVSVLECILGGLHIGVEVEPEPERARQKLAKSKIDALIVDCDVNGSGAFLRGIENKLIKNSVPLVIISGSGGRAKLNDSAASFIFEKPISVEQAVHTLSAARNMILDGRLRYHRHTLDLPVSFSCGASSKRHDAHLLNLSQGGVRLRLKQPMALQQRVLVSLTLPGSERPARFTGEVAWMDEQCNAGIRFVNTSVRVRQSLKVWLERQYLTH